MRAELKIPIFVRLLFLAALVLIGLEAGGVISSDSLPVVHVAIALFALAAVIWGFVAVMRFRR